MKMKTELPQFLFCENINGKRSFVMYCHRPQVLFEFVDHSRELKGTAVEIFDCTSHLGDNDLAKLARYAGEWLIEYNMSLMNK